MEELLSQEEKNPLIPKKECPFWEDGDGEFVNSPILSNGGGVNAKK
mgnify:CR=1 FL=1